LRAAGDLAVVPRQVARAGGDDAGDAEASRDLRGHELVRAVEIREVAVHPQDEGIEEAAGAEQDGAAAARSPGEGDAFLGAAIDVDLAVEGPGGADDDRELRPGPESQSGLTTRLGLVEQGFIEREVLGERGKGQVEPRHELTRSLN